MLAISFQINGGKKCSWKNLFCNSTGPEPLKYTLRHKSPGAILKKKARCWQRRKDSGRDLLSYVFKKLLLFNSMTEILVLKVVVLFHLAEMWQNRIVSYFAIAWETYFEYSYGNWKFSVKDCCNKLWGEASLNFSLFKIRRISNSSVHFRNYFYSQHKRLRGTVSLSVIIKTGNRA